MIRLIFMTAALILPLIGFAQSAESALGDKTRFYNCMDFCAIGDFLFFSASDSLHGNELWKTDGTAEGTTMVCDIVRGEKSSNPQDIVCVNHKAFFTINKEKSYQLWVSDGTRSGTTRVRFKSGKNNQVFGYEVIDTMLVFFTENHSLWTTTGTKRETKFIKTFDGFPNPLYHPTEQYNESTMWFTAGWRLSYSQIWKTNGQKEGTLMIKEFISEDIDTVPSFIFPTKQDEMFMFIPFEKGFGIYKTNGIPGDVSDVASFTNKSLDDYEYTILNNIMYFVVYDSLGGTLWRSDGTEAGTYMVHDARPMDQYGPHQLLNTDQELYFTIDDGSDGKIWKSDGTSEGTQVACDLNKFSGDEYVIIDRIFRFNNNIAIVALCPSFGKELWIYSSATNDVRMMKDISPGDLDSDISNVCTVGNVLYFSVQTGALPSQLWVTDGTTEGTKKIEYSITPVRQ